MPDSQELKVGDRVTVQPNAITTCSPLFRELIDKPGEVTRVHQEDGYALVTVAFEYGCYDTASYLLKKLDVSDDSQ